MNDKDRFLAVQPTVKCLMDGCNNEHYEKHEIPKEILFDVKLNQLCCKSNGKIGYCWLCKEKEKKYKKRWVMEYLTVELDCTEIHCDKCHYVIIKPICPLNMCGYFRKELSIDESNYELFRLPECLAACKKHKIKVE